MTQQDDKCPEGSVHHDRKAVTSADTWGKEPMERETALEMLEKLGNRGYDVRLTVEAKHEDSNVVKTVDNEEDAQTTLMNIRLDEEYPK